MKRILFLILVLGVFALVGCGSSNDDFTTHGGGGTGSGTGGGSTGTTSGGSTTGGTTLPVANDDGYTTLGNATVSFPLGSGVSNNDTLNGGTVSAFQATSAENGTVQVNADGSFSYNPAFGFTGTDTFTYTLSNTAGSDTATVTVLVPESAYFVDNSRATNGNGGLSTPFNNASDAFTAADENDVIFLFKGTGASNSLAGAFTLKDGQSVIGEGVGLQSDGVIVVAGDRPNTGLQLTLGDNNIIAGCIMSLGGSGTLIEGSGIDRATIRENILNIEAATAVNLLDVTGNIILSSNRVIATAANADAFRIFQNSSSDPAATVTVSNNTFEARNSPIFALLSGPAAQGGIALDCQTNSGSLDLTVSQNSVLGETANNKWSRFLFVNPDVSSTITMSLLNNTFSNIENDAISISCVDRGLAEIVASGNTGTNLEADGISLSCIDNSRGMFNSTGNTITSLDRGVRLQTADSASLVARVSSSSCTSTNSFSLSASAVGASQVCLDVSGNTASQGIDLAQSGTATLEVEDLNTPLSSLNNGANVTTSGTVANVADGTCQF